MNPQISSQVPYSPPSSSGESDDITSLDSPSFQSAPPLSTSLSGEATCPPHKRKAGRKKFKETCHPIFRGVRERDGGKWVCEVREPNKKSRIWLGTYPTAELPARAHDVATLALRGDKASLNFPDSAWLAPRAKSSSAQDIRLAALQATRSDLGSSSPYEGCKSEDMGEKSSMSFESKELLFIDEEVIYNMPAFIDSMAAGMLLTPPSLKRGVNWDEMEEDEANCHIDLNLWQ
ncbi:dehydration-responsive element-binding protein 1F-like [Chenopodium quinoa]|uniref:AP2/ERF domain-containing protein n=1 Tax=Chenopodium quinoa TaxID=63459 RepID=A0A803LD67_CHEQI|nr:dehydration-responsive element-binding protein 1F-like [Chenopodium quinoa]